ncbi:hypothetical protein [Nocardia wallacei]|uniref:hypothetical protein n=1 Tax=Nocardia wallacei TaxID=480035 RepID=UPI0024578A94|nr:hypothetical protein [Nocardia wallacei]
MPAGVEHGVEAAGWAGVVLPQTTVSDFTVFPVVEIDAEVWEERVKKGYGPELDRSTLVIWESWTTDLGEMPPRPAVSIVGLVSTATRPADALYALDSLAGYGAGLWIATGVRGPTAWTLSKFDVVGVGVVAERSGGHEVLVEGRSGPIATARRLASTRHKEEQLFGWALATGYSPAGAVSTTPTH